MTVPNYDFKCANDHLTEKRFTVSAKPDTIECPECGEEARTVILGAPYTWTNTFILDYPGSKALKAGYVHSHGDHGVEKLSVGYGGALNPRHKREAPSWIKNIQPESPPDYSKE